MGAKIEKTKQLKDKICELIATSNKGLRAVSKEAGVGITFLLEWLRNDSEFAAQYARAKQEQADILFEEILEIADETSNDTIHVPGKNGGEGYDVPNKEWIDRSKLRVDARKWAASKLAPKKYGDKMELDLVSTKIKVTLKKNEE